MRYYYKLKTGKGLLNLKTQLEIVSKVEDGIDENGSINYKEELVFPEEYKDYERITEEEYNALKPKPRVLTEAEKNNIYIRAQINELKQLLSDTDYKCLKYVDGALTEEEYLPVKQLRQNYRDQINELERQLVISEN